MASLHAQLASLQQSRDAIAEELVQLAAKNEQLEGDAARLPVREAELKEV